MMAETTLRGMIAHASDPVCKPAARRARFQARSWWILPGIFSGVLVWIGFFKLIGVL